MIPNTCEHQILQLPITPGLFTLAIASICCTQYFLLLLYCWLFIIMLYICVLFCSFLSIILCFNMLNCTLNGAPYTHFIYKVYIFPSSIFNLPRWFCNWLSVTKQPKNPDFFSLSFCQQKQLRIFTIFNLKHESDETLTLSKDIWFISAL